MEKPMSEVVVRSEDDIKLHRKYVGKTIDMFVQEMDYRIVHLDKENTGTSASYSEGMAAGYRYALAIYRERREAGTI